VGNSTCIDCDSALGEPIAFFTASQMIFREKGFSRNSAVAIEFSHGLDRLRNSTKRRSLPRKKTARNFVSFFLMATELSQQRKNVYVVTPPMV
jgi:hypothetical protein